MSWFRRFELRPACILLLVVTVTFFTCPDLLLLQNQLYLCLQSKNHIAVHQSEQTCALIKLSRRQKASKLTQDHFSVAQVIIVRVFFIFHYIVLFSSALWKLLFFIRITFYTRIVLFTSCEVENDNSRQWLQNNWLFSRKQLLQLDLTEASKTNPNDRLSLICLNEDPRMDQLTLLKIAKWWIMAWLPSCNWSFAFKIFR